MRVTIIVAFTCMQVTIAAAQIRISVNFVNTPLFEAIQVIQKQLGNEEKMRYDKCFDGAKLVNYQVNNGRLEAVLFYVFKDQRLEPTYTYGVLGCKPRTVFGIVKDKNGTPQPGVNVYGDGLKYTVTNAKGNFMMDMGACDSFFVFTGRNLQA